MKTSTMLLIGGGATAALYFLGKGAVKSACMAAPQSIPSTILQAAEAAVIPGVVTTPDQQCSLLADAVPFFTTVKVGAIQFFRPITPADLA